MDLYELLKYIIKTFESLNIQYFITGSIAGIFYGEPRFTNDIDIVADIKKKHIPDLLKTFSEDEFYISKEAVLEAIKYNSQFNIIHPASGLKVDIIIRKQNDFDDSRFNRINKITPIENTIANFASPEDVILMKMKYYKQGQSEKHIRDIVSILKISGDLINKDYIDNWAKKLDVLNIWIKILNKSNIIK